MLEECSAARSGKPLTLEEVVAEVKRKHTRHRTFLGEARTIAKVFFALSEEQRIREGCDHLTNRLRTIALIEYVAGLSVSDLLALEAEYADELSVTSRPIRLP